MLETRQKPIDSVGVAWWPGGRTAQNAAAPSPRAQRGDGGQTGAGGERRGRGRLATRRRVGIDPAASRRRRRRRVGRGTTPGWTRSRSARDAGRGSSGTIAGASSASPAARVTAPRRDGRSGWWAPVRCSRNNGWVAQRTVTRPTLRDVAAVTRCRRARRRCRREPHATGTVRCRAPVQRASASRASGHELRRLEVAWPGNAMNVQSGALRSLVVRPASHDSTLVHVRMRDESVLPGSDELRWWLDSMVIEHPHAEEHPHGGVVPTRRDALRRRRLRGRRSPHAAARRSPP